MDLSNLARIIDQNSGGEGMHETAITGMWCFKRTGKDCGVPALYNPSICVVVQGCKKVLLEGEIYHYGAGQFLAISVDLPVVGQIVEASPERPYLCLKLDLDPHMMGELLATLPAELKNRGNGRLAAPPRGLLVGDLDEDLLDAVRRLVRLLETPRDAPLLAPMVWREIHYRLICGPYGAVLAQMAVAGSSAERIARVIWRIKKDLAAPLRVEDLAAMAHMSPSSFHQHFKAVTAMSPLQYQKRLRLTEARNILLLEEADAAETARRVGYESASQFSREYARMFGAPPRADARALRSAGLAAEAMAA